jgi:hypothetical protein
VVDLVSGASCMVPVNLIEGLARAPVEAVREVEVSPGGEALHWEALDVDLAVPALLMGAFGTGTWMRELGRRGGRRTSPAKAAAARRNGRKGGRPRRGGMARKEGGSGA